MDVSYPFREVEAKWQRAWKERAVARPGAFGAGPGEGECIFSWPEGASAAGLDLSVARRWAIADAVARFRRHQGVAPFLPLAVDGFDDALSAAARAGGKSPRDAALEEARRIDSIARSIGSAPEEPPVATSEPSYYRFTQWIFLQLHAKRLVVRSEGERAVCSRCGRRYRPGARAACPRCGGDLDQKRIGEWRLDLSPLGDRLVNDLERVDFPGALRSIQRALIGRCRGSEVVFPVSRPFELEYQDLGVFTTQVETIFGVTFLVVDPDHPILQHVLDAAYEDDVARYRERLRKGAEPAISAVRTGGFALNPANLKRIPILASPLASRPYSEGAIMAVPAHDADLFVLAKRLKLGIREVLHSDKAKFDSQTRLEEPWLGDGILTNSGSFSSLPSRVGRDRIISFLARRGVCRRANRYLLRTLGLSGGSPWGPPVPLVHCKRCGAVPVPDAELPVELPAQAIGAAAPPAEIHRLLASRAPCPRCGQTAARDGETILPWLGTAWSFVRLILPALDGRVEGFRDREASSPDGSSPPGSEPAAGAGEGGEAGSLRTEGAPGAGAPDGEAPAAAAAPFPEDVDVFEIEPEGSSIGEDAPDPEGGEAGGPAPPAAAPGGEPPAAGAPAADAAPDAALDAAPAADAALPAAPEDVAEGGPEQPPVEHPPAERPQRGRRGEGGPPGGKEGGRGRRPADEPETIVLKDLEGEDEEEIEEPGPAPSPLRPFRLAEARAPLPAAFALGPAGLDPTHLIAARFLAKFLKDLGHLHVDEPFARYCPVAPVRAVPDAAAGADILERFGADALRLQLLFAAPPAGTIVTGADAVLPFRRFLDRVWRQMMLRLEKGKFVSRRMLEEKHRLIHLVTCRLSQGKIHTAIAALMRFVRFLESPETAPEDMDRVAMRTFTVLLSPFAPHLAEEIWSRMGEEADLASAAWPIPSDELINPPEREFLIQVDGRVRDRMQQPSNLEPEKLESRALQRDRIREIVGNRKVERVVVVPQRLVNLVLAPA
jgi:leucyl-tRNA synthetase